jgi:hypothetical protein
MKKFIAQLLGTFKEKETASNEHFANHYNEWRTKRLDAIIEHYGEGFFKGKSLLELGCGHGDIGAFFSKFGAEVTCSDARWEHLDVVKSKHPQVKVQLANLENEWPFEGKFDIIINFGVIYHLSNPDFVVEKSCIYSDYLILETEVCDSDDENVILFTKESGYDQAFSGVGCRPSPDYLEKIFQKFEKQYERIKDDKCNSGIHIYDWKVKNTKKNRPGLRRLWFIENKS